MKERKFSKKEAVGFGWKIMRENFWFFVGILMVLFVLSAIPDILRGMIKINQGQKVVIPLFILFIIFSLVFWVLQIITSLGTIKIALKFCDNQKPAFKDLFSCYPLFFRYTAASILYFLMVVGGLILLIIPGIIWGIKFQYFAYSIIDKKLGVISALKESARITKGAKWQLFLFGLLLMGIMILGALAFLVGLFAAIPASMIAQAYVYRILLAKAKD